MFTYLLNLTEQFFNINKFTIKKKIIKKKLNAK